MKLHAAIRIATVALGVGLATSAWAGGHHQRDVGIGSGSEHGHAPAFSSRTPSAPPKGGDWHDIPHPGERLADGGHDHHDHGGGNWGGHDHGSDHGHWGGDHGHWGDHDWHHDWGHGDIRYFYYYDWDAWNGGYWDHGWWGGRFGWWWVVSGVWFFYPVPVYPYPDPYIPSDFAAPPPPPGTLATQQFWYFCPASNAYYPYVPACPTGWQQVPAIATAEPQPPNPPPPGG